MITGQSFSLTDTEAAVSLESEVTLPEEAEVIQPNSWYLLVKPIGPAKKIGSIHLTVSAIDRQSLLGNAGRIVAVGPLAFQTGDLAKVPNPPKRGDYVMYRQHSGERFKYNGVEMVLVLDTQVLGSGYDPAKLQLFSV